jgi:hypothetical protein
VPRDNPFIGREGARPEIWAYGLRNVWRMAFDRKTGQLWAGDVGQNLWEEINLSPAPGRGRGVDYGWDSYEGTHRYAGEPDRGGTVKPVFEYSHAAGCSVTGGFVYRGNAIPALRGAYLYSDYCTGGVRLITVAGTTVTLTRNLGLSIASVASFGEDANGEVYVLSALGAVARIDPA